MPTAVSLFSGCGGSDTGIIQAGFDVLMANDILPYARDVYMANLHETDYIVKNIKEIKSFPLAELLVGCYPCQGFSQGGARQPERKINKLYEEFARALNIVKPKAFIVENVSGMIRKNFFYLLEDQIRLFTEAGYNVAYSILNAADYGVPQERKRIFIVGIQKKYRINYIFPQKLYGTKENPYICIREAIGDLPRWPVGEFYDQPLHWYYMSRNRRRDWEEISKTIVANPRHMPLHPISPPLRRLHTDAWEFTSNEPARRFSYKEAARLQGFKNLIFPETVNGSLAAKYTVVGNAVPPPLFEAVAKNLPDIWT